MNQNIIWKLSRFVWLSLLGIGSIGTVSIYAPILFTLPEGRLGCDTPVHWKLGEVDSRFPVERQQFLRTALEAERLWEKPTGKELLIYDPNASFTVTTVFDDRQKMTYDTRKLQTSIDRYQKQAETLKKSYETLLAGFRRDQAALNTKMDAFQRDFTSYQDNVSRVNASGGAKPQEYASLEKQRKALENEQASINKESDRLNKVASTVNATAGQFNSETADARDNLAKYHLKYGEPKPFIEGLYESPLKSITIYQFESTDDLRLVLAHEFGHALGIEEHVADSQEAIMYAMMGGQNLDHPALTKDDISIYKLACPTLTPSIQESVVSYLVLTPVEKMDFFDFLNIFFK